MAIIIGGGASATVPASSGTIFSQFPMTQLWGDGDSKGGEGLGAFTWAVARLNLDLWVGGKSFSVGGSTTANGTSPLGLTNATRLATITSAIEAATTAGEIVDIVLTIGTNDVGLSAIPSETTIANVKIYHDAIRNAGCRYLFLMSIDPRSGLTATKQAMINSTNKAYEDYCRRVSDAFYVDTIGYLIDPTSTTFGPIGGDTGGTFAISADGLHCSGYGIYRKSFAVEGVAQWLYRARPLEILATGNAYNTSTSIRGNILGSGGRFLAIGGTDAFVKTDTSSVTGTPPATFRTDGTLNGDTSLVYTVSTCDALGEMFGGTWPCVNVALAGTPASSTNIQIAGRFAAFTFPAGTRMRGRALVNLKSVTGLARLFLSTQNVTPAQFCYLGTSSAVTAEGELPELNGLHVLDIVCDPSSALNCGLNLNIAGLAGRPLGGSIDLIGMDWRRADVISA